MWATRLNLGGLRSIVKGTNGKKPGPFLDVLCRNFQSLSILQTNTGYATVKKNPFNTTGWRTLNASVPPMTSLPTEMSDCLFIQKRNTSFYNKVTAAQLWKGVTSVSNAGRKRGRGKGVGRKFAKDLNRGQVIGVGKINMVWPGLNAPVLQGKELVHQKELPPDTDREAKILKMRDTMGVFRSLKLSPLERGWSGTKMHGRSVGPPDPIGTDTFEGFDTKILEMKNVTHMDGNYGRKKRYSVVAFTGNKNGLAGFAAAKNPDGRAAIKRAKNRAGQKLLFIERYNDHTVLHDFFCAFGQTKIYVYRKPEGFGLVCHRAIRTMCEVIGIKDLYAKIEGSTNLQHIVKAFMLGLLRQKPYELMAEDKQLFVVEQREENQNIPIVLATPTECRRPSEIPTHENLDFRTYGFDGRIVLKRKKFVPFYTKLPSWQNHLLKSEFKRNQQEVKIRLTNDYGGRRSHLTSKYPECDALYAGHLYRKHKREAAAAAGDENE